jgi:hypothetical protein
MKTNKEIMRKHEIDEDNEVYLSYGSIIRMMEEAQYEVIKKIEDNLIPIESKDVTGFVGMKKDDFNVIKKELLNEELK